MIEENTPQATWSEGGEIEGMEGNQAKSEIKAIESDPSFSGDGKMPYWDRQNMLKRRDLLYRHVAGEDADKPYTDKTAMGEELLKQGITTESLEEMHEGFEDRDEQDTRRKIMETLTSHFGTKEDAEAALGDAKDILKRFAMEDDLIFLEESGLGNDSEFIKKLSEIGQMFKRANKEAREKNEK